jgi:hypothetical protein
MLSNKISRRGFLKKAVAGLLVAAAVPTELKPDQYIDISHINFQPPLRSEHAEERQPLPELQLLDSDHVTSGSFIDVPGIHSVEITNHPLVDLDNVWKPIFLEGDSVSIQVDTRIDGFVEISDSSPVPAETAGLVYAPGFAYDVDDWETFIDDYYQASPEEPRLIENARLTYITVTHELGYTYPINLVYPLTNSTE